MDKSNICETIVHIPPEALICQDDCYTGNFLQGSSSWFPEFIVQMFIKHRSKDKALNLVEKIV